MLDHLTTGDVDLIDKWVSGLKESPDNRIPQPELINLCSKAEEILMREPNVARCSAPLCVVGDIHGQFHDLLELFRICGDLPDTNYLFLGDYVDRGYFSVECFSLLISLKVRFPQRVTLLRGNHESRQITQV